MKINWEARIRNKLFWVTLIPAVLLLVQLLFAIFDVDCRPKMIADEVGDLINAVLGIMVTVGIVVDPTTTGISDSDLSMSYIRPRDDSEAVADEDIKIEDESYVDEDYDEEAHSREGVN